MKAGKEIVPGGKEQFQSTRNPGLSRSKFHAMALNEYPKQRETEEMVRSIDEAYADRLDDDDCAS
jgi:hypothetical protein